MSSSSLVLNSIEESGRNITLDEFRTSISSPHVGTPGEGMDISIHFSMEPVVKTTPAHVYALSDGEGSITERHFPSSPLSTSSSHVKRVSKTLVALSKCILVNGNNNNVSSPSSPTKKEQLNGSFYADNDCVIVVPPGSVAESFNSLSPRAPELSPILSSSGNIDAKLVIDRLTEMIKNNEMPSTRKVTPQTYSCPSSPKSPCSDSCSTFSQDDDCDGTLIGPSVIQCITNEMLWPQHSFCSLCHLAAKYNSVEVLGWLKDCCCDEECTGSHSTTEMVVEHTVPTPVDASAVQSVSPYSINDCQSPLSGKPTPTNDTFSTNSVISNTTSYMSGHFHNNDHQHNSSSSPSHQAHHSNSCLNRQRELWSIVDNQSSSPLMYAVHSGSHDASVFLCSQPTVQNQLNFTRDKFGNLPIVLALKKRDFELCDILQLFGAKIDTIGGVQLGESLLHSALRERDVTTAEYLIRKNPKIILKKNQRDEIPLFRCLTDNRPTSVNKLITISLPGDSQKSPSLRSNRVSIRETHKVGEHSLALSQFLQKSTEWIDIELIEKSISSKNSFGRNLLLEAVAINDVDSTKVICEFISQNYSSFETQSNSKRVKSYEDIILDTDKIYFMNIIQTAVSSSLQVIQNRREEFLYVFAGLKWLIDWLDSMFNQPFSTISLHGMLAFKDSRGLTAFDMASKDKESCAFSTIMSQFLVETESRWKPTKAQHQSMVLTKRRSSISLSAKSTSSTPNSPSSPSSGGLFSKLKSKFHKHTSSRQLK